jgi:hypothetical protein
MNGFACCRCGVAVGCGVLSDWISKKCVIYFEEFFLASVLIFSLLCIAGYWNYVVVRIIIETSINILIFYYYA